jgi:hypothetical protein
MSSGTPRYPQALDLRFYELSTDVPDHVFSYPHNQRHGTAMDRPRHRPHRRVRRRLGASRRGHDPRRAPPRCGRRRSRGRRTRLFRVGGVALRPELVVGLPPLLDGAALVFDRPHSGRTTWSHRHDPCWSYTSWQAWTPASSPPCRPAGRRSAGPAEADIRLHDPELSRVHAASTSGRTACGSPTSARPTEPASGETPMHDAASRLAPGDPMRLGAAPCRSARRTTRRRPRDPTGWVTCSSTGRRRSSRPSSRRRSSIRRRHHRSPAGSGCRGRPCSCRCCSRCRWR